jgi:hypothetical protein
MSPFPTLNDLIPVGPGENYLTLIKKDPWPIRDIGQEAIPTNKRHFSER